jgi:hypothetical protein
LFFRNEKIRLDQRVGGRGGVFRCCGGVGLMTGRDGAAAWIIKNQSFFASFCSQKEESSLVPLAAHVCVWASPTLQSLYFETRYVIIGSEYVTD